MPRLVLKSGTQTHSFELRPGVNRLGRRREGNDFQIDDPSVSAAHCEVLVQGDSVTVRDYGSTNGTFIDGQPVREASVQLGQTLRLGQIELVLEAPLINISIPQLDLRAPTPPPPLSDGSVACLNHAERRATFECTKCHRAFCTACIHELHRIGGRSYKFCPVCSGHCQSIVPVAARKKRSIFNFLRVFKKTSKMPGKPK
jgi:hypothetical protein